MFLITRLCLCICLFIAYTFSQDDAVEIQSDTVWGGFGDTISVPATVSIDSNVTLTIAEGTTILLERPAFFIVYGKMIAKGTAEHCIIFSAADTSRRWGSIVFKENGQYADTSIFEYCVFEYSDGNSIRADGYNYIRFTNCIMRKNYIGVTFTSTDFSLTNCRLTNNSSPGSTGSLKPGGGISAFNSFCSISGNRIDSNRTTYGGGIYLEQCSGSIENNLISDNNARYGGGIILNSIKKDSIVIRGNKIHHNLAMEGGGVYVALSPGLKLESTYITNNEANEGGGIYVHNATITIINNLIANNTTSGSGGGLYTYDTTNILIINTTIANNEVSGIYCFMKTPRVSLVNTIVWPKDKMLSESNNYTFQNCFPPSLTGSSSTDTLDPLFQNPSAGIGNNFDAQAADWNLRNESPCVNRGTPDTTGLGIPQYDLGGKPRVFVQIDIGAFENQVSSGVIPEKFVVRNDYLLTNAIIQRGYMYRLNGCAVRSTEFYQNLSQGIYIHKIESKTPIVSIRIK